MASFEMKNDAAKVVIDEHASEIHSFINAKTGLEYMWQGDPKFWKGRNPTLFPMVGSTWDKILHIDGKEYKTGNHGFTRNSDFTCVSHTDDQIVMELKDSESTLAEYPFHFCLRITYTLKDNTLTVHYDIRNENDRVMPFNFGLHPAFNCPVEPGKAFEDYYLTLNQPETFSWNGTVLENGTRLELNREKLAETIIIADPKSTESALTDGSHGVTVGFKGYRWLAFWSPNAPFVCIEPWFSHTDFEEVKVPFEEREGTLFLEANGTWSAEYTITVW